MKSSVQATEKKASEFLKDISFKSSSLRLFVDLQKIAQNYETIKKETKTDIAAVVKANGYGMGVIPVSTAVYEAGCRKIFVATLAEGIQLRRHFPQNIQIYILNGFSEEDIPFIKEHKLIPVLHSLESFLLWKSYNTRGTR